MPRARSSDSVLRPRSRAPRSRAPRSRAPAAPGTNACGSRVASTGDSCSLHRSWDAPRSWVLPTTCCPPHWRPWPTMTAVTLGPSPTVDGVPPMTRSTRWCSRGVWAIGSADGGRCRRAGGPPGGRDRRGRSRRPLGRGVGRPATAIRVARSLAGAGFVVRSWLAWPAIGRATTFAALDDEVAIRWLVRRRLGAGAGSAVAAVAGRLAGTWLLPALAPAVILVARRGEIGPSVLERHVAPAAGGAPGAPVDGAPSSPRGLIRADPALSRLGPCRGPGHHGRWCTSARRQSRAAA